jgi:hypothetical protein
MTLFGLDWVQAMTVPGRGPYEVLVRGWIPPGSEWQHRNLRWKPQDFPGVECIQVIALHQGCAVHQNHVKPQVVQALADN